jgi:hypothetical protein
MSIASKIANQNSVGNLSFIARKTVNGNAAVIQSQQIAAAQAGTLTTRTDADTGVITMDASGHTITVTPTVAVYWTDATSGLTKCRRGMTVSDVSGDEVTIDGGSGDDLPALSTAVMVAIEVSMNADVTGDDVKAVFCHTAAYGQFIFADNSGTELLVIELGAGYVYQWQLGNGTDNPVAGDSIGQVLVSHNGSTAQTMKVAVVYDNA